MDQERPKADRPVGRRVADVMERVLSTATAGKRLRLEAGPDPSPPSLRVEDKARKAAETFIRAHLGIGPEEEIGDFIGVNEDYVESTGGKSQFMKFAGFWQGFIHQQDPDSLARIHQIGQFSAEEMGALRFIIRREVERRIKRKIWKSAWASASALAFGTFMAVRYGFEALDWIWEHAGRVKEMLTWLLKSGSGA